MLVKDLCSNFSYAVDVNIFLSEKDQNDGKPIYEGYVRDIVEDDKEATGHKYYESVISDWFYNTDGNLDIVLDINKAEKKGENNMLKQNWFCRENMVQYHNYFGENVEVEEYYDKETKYFYILRAEHTKGKGITIQEVQPGHELYSDCYVEYINYLINTKLDNLSVSEFIDVTEAEIESERIDSDEETMEAYDHPYEISWMGYKVSIPFSADVHYKIQDALKEIIKGGDAE